MTSQQSKKEKTPNIIFLVTEDWYFWSHRLPMARASRDAGFNVGVATRVRAHGELIKKEGFALYPLHWKRSDLSPVRFLRAAWEIANLYKIQKPTIVHHVALKPVIIGSLAAKFAGVKHIVNAMTGLGHLFTSSHLKVRFFRFLLRPLLAVALRGQRTTLLFQNDDDRSLLKRMGYADCNTVIIRGSGVDTRHFQALPQPNHGVPVAGFVGRMIEIKGIRVLVAAFLDLQRRGVPLKLVLAGAPDDDNPGAISSSEIESWAKTPDIEWLGHVQDVRTLWARADIAVQPSLGGEGLPKSLLEAAACGRPIVATDVPGSREIALTGRNAILSIPGDKNSLSEALSRLSADPDLRRRFGEESRKLVVSEFDDATVGKQIVALYNRLLA